VRSNGPIHASELVGSPPHVGGKIVRLHNCLAGAALAAAAGLLFGFQPSTAFDLDAYREHLARSRDLTAIQIIDSRRPYGPFLENVSLGAEPEYLDAVTAHFQLTAGEQQLLRDHGLMVSERLQFASFGDAIEDIWRADLPVFVSSDAILHALHRSYDTLLAQVETAYSSPELGTALAASHDAWLTLNAR
jgi:hypothetical protein